MEYQTNTIVEHHSAWTLSKHLAQSVNKAAANVDAKVYGTHTSQVVVPVQEPMPLKDFFIGAGCFVLVCIMLVALFSGQMKWWQMFP